MEFRTSHVYRFIQPKGPINNNTPSVVSLLLFSSIFSASDAIRIHRKLSSTESHGRERSSSLSALYSGQMQQGFLWKLEKKNWKKDGGQGLKPKALIGCLFVFVCLLACFTTLTISPPNTYIVIVCFLFGFGNYNKKPKLNNFVCLFVLF